MIAAREYLSQGQVREGVARVAESAEKFQVDVVVGILEAGRQFALDVAELLKVECGFAQARSYEGMARREVVVVSVPQLPPSRILLLDTIVDSGETMWAMKRELTGWGHEVVTGALIAKKSVDCCAFFDPSAPFLLGYGLDYNGKYRELTNVVEWRGGNDGIQGN